MSTVDTKQDGGFLVQPVRGTPEDWAAFRALSPMAQMDAALEALYRALDIRGENYVYSRNGVQAPRVVCMYLENPLTTYEAPSCLIGVVLWQLGAPVAHLRRHSGTVNKTNDSRGWGLHLSTLLLWQAAQVAQDGGSSWGDAVAMATGLREVARKVAEASTQQ